MALFTFIYISGKTEAKNSDKKNEMCFSNHKSKIKIIYISLLRTHKIYTTHTNHHLVFSGSGPRHFSSQAPPSPHVGCAYTGVLPEALSDFGGTPSRPISKVGDAYRIESSLGWENQREGNKEKKKKSVSNQSEWERARTMGREGS